MQNDPDVELYICFKRSYDEILWHHHSFVVRSIVSVSLPLFGFVRRRWLLTLFEQVAMRAVPRRRDFYARLAEGGSTGKLDTLLVKWLSGLEVLVSHLRGFLEGGGYGRVV